jgi:uncharacterized membrane protein YhhN
MPTSRVILVLYAFIATTNVMASAIANDSLFWATKPLLMPLLAGVVIFAGVGRPSLVAGLCFATVGDVFLMVHGDMVHGDMVHGDGWFYAGMAAFAATHVCYLIAFARAGAWRRLRRMPLVAVPVLYALVVVAAELVLRLPVPILLYGCLLAAMAASAAGLGWRAGVGGALFLLSDLLIGIGLGGTDLPGPPIWVMLTYVLGQALIVLGWLHRHESAAPAIPHQRAGTRSDGATSDGARSDEQVRAE